GDRVRRGEERADGTERDERRDHASPQDEQRDRGDAEQHELPPGPERARERDRAAEDRPDRSGAGAVEERTRRRIHAERAEPAAAPEDEREGGAERDRCSEQPPAEPSRRVADDGDG